MKKMNNNLLLENWIKLLLSIYKGSQYYENLPNNTTKINEIKSLIILKNQIALLKKRKSEYQRMTINDFLNYTSLNKFFFKNKFHI